MPIAAKVKWETMDYGWLFKITNFVDLMEYWEKVRSYRLQDGFSNLMRSRELADLVGSPGVGVEHMSHSDAFGIYSRSLSANGTVLDAVSAFARDLMSGMLKAIDEFGSIYVNSKGGYFTPGPNMNEYDSREIDTWVLPGETISVKQWPGGKHWYAYVGGTRVIRNGEEKWSSKAMAELNGEKWAKENGIKLEEED